MSHFPDTGRVWSIGQQSISAGLQDMDAKAKKTMNGSTGDTSAPAATIEVGGEGIAVQNEILWVSPQTYNRVISPLRFTENTLRSSPGLGWTLGFATFASLTSLSQHQSAYFPLDIELIDGATIDTIALSFRVSGSRPAQAITTYPTLWLSRKNDATGLNELIPFTGSNEFPTPANWAAYLAGNPNVVTLTLDNTGGEAVIDMSTYSYTLLFIDDLAGSPVGPYNSITGLEIQMSNVTTQRQP